MEFIALSRDGPVTRVMLNRPEALNAINPAMHGELQAAFDDFANDPTQELCIVTGAGSRAFCAGSDLKAVATSGFAAYPRNGYAGLIERFDCNKPIIAAVNGFALGGGFEIVLACDIVIAERHSTFGLPEPLVGAIALGGGLHRLARQVPFKQAMGTILASRRLSAEDGLRMGFVNEVVETGLLDEGVHRWIEDIMRAAPIAIRTSKAVVMRGLAESSVEDAMSNQSAYPEFREWSASEDVREGPAAFAAKRAPRWSGR